jgi:hypothetical protein
MKKMEGDNPIKGLGKHQQAMNFEKPLLLQPQSKTSGSFEEKEGARAWD